jgi:hypothetical protein
LVHGDISRSRKYLGSDGRFRDAREKLPDLARKEGLIFVSHDFTPMQWVEISLKAMGQIIEDQDLLMAATPEESLALYPLVLKQYEILEKRKIELEEQIEAEHLKNTNAKAWFDAETQKAKRGERVRSVMHYDRTKIVGYVGGMRHTYKDSEWNGGNTITEYSDREPQYETFYTDEPDYPKEPIYFNDAQYSNPSIIADIHRQMSELLAFPIKYEKLLSDQQDKIKKLKELEAQEQELKDRIARLRSSI